jgi:hypothetical protein
VNSSNASTRACRMQTSNMTTIHIRPFFLQHSLQLYLPNLQSKTALRHCSLAPLACCPHYTQGTQSQLSSQVLTISPTNSSSSSSRSSVPWAAQPASPALPAGLIGHSVALYGSRVFISGGMEAAAAAQPSGEAGGCHQWSHEKLRFTANGRKQLL